MRFGGFGFDRQFGFNAPNPIGAAAAPPGGELFPDPTLASVTNGALYEFTDGFPTFGPAGGTGPGIGILAVNDSAVSVALAVDGAYEATFVAGVGSGSTKSVALTVTGTPDGCAVFVILRGGTPVEFVFDAEDTFIHNVTAGSDGIGTGTTFKITGSENSALTGFTITHVSVTTP